MMRRRTLLRIVRIQQVLVKYGLDEIIAATHLLRPLRYFFILAPRRRDRSAPLGERIRLALEELGPIFVKFGQAISTRRRTGCRRFRAIRPWQSSRPLTADRWTRFSSVSTANRWPPPRLRRCTRPASREVKRSSSSCSGPTSRRRSKVISTCCGRLRDWPTDTGNTANGCGRPRLSPSTNARSSTNST